jgi:uncharacterized protein (TIRG00374 family)
MKLKLNMQRITIIMVVLFVAACITVMVLDWHDMRRIIGQANWFLILPALLFTAASYTCLSYSLAVVFRTFGIDLPVKDIMEIGFVSNVINYLLNVGGVTGVSLEFVLFKKRGLATEDILAPSLFHLYFNGLMLIALLPIGLFSVLFSQHLSRSVSLGLGIADGVLTLLLILATIIVFVSSFRAVVLRGLSRVAQFITRRKVNTALQDFNTAMGRGVAAIRQRPGTLALLVALMVGDWASTVAALWFCFYALGNPVGLGKLLTGFSLGITAGFVSLVPGGLGVQEGSMAGIYALLGVPIGVAIVAAILFRIVYYFIPFLASLGFYRRLLREDK